jgi:hypothetical protein
MDLFIYLSTEYFASIFPLGLCSVKYKYPIVYQDTIFIVAFKWLEN